ncbi:uncharacterized protein LOC143915477 [Arctopsyche grandis]|uniref:uncharacterized protein LOC143915477 n=1 Tax=Arctopsyche grandis TaxID=121162 RepID=UPI00406D8A68
MDSNNVKSGECCACKCTAATCVQSLDDMEFERGIWYAAQCGDVKRVKKLAVKGVDLLDAAGYTALHHAARAGHLEVCRLLIDLGASVNVQTRAALATPLHRAASAGKLEVVKLLMTSGGDLLRKDDDGQTPLHRAAAEGHVEIVRILVSANGSPLSQLDNRGRSPADLAKLSPNKDDAFYELFR